MKTEDRVRQVVRGEAHWSTLRGPDSAIEHDGNAWRFSGTQTCIAARPIDVAVGIRNLTPRPNDLIEWASFLLAAPQIDMEQLHKSPHGETLLTALWDLCFERQPSEDLAHLVKAVLGGE